MRLIQLMSVPGNSASTAQEIVEFLSDFGFTDHAFHIGRNIEVSLKIGFLLFIEIIIELVTNVVEGYQRRQFSSLPIQSMVRYNLLV